MWERIEVGGGADRKEADYARARHRARAAFLNTSLVNSVTPLLKSSMTDWRFVRDFRTDFTPASAEERLFCLDMASSQQTARESVCVTGTEGSEGSCKMKIEKCENEKCEK